MSKQPVSDFKKITIKNAQQLIKNLNGKEDISFEKNYHNVVYILNNGHVILYLDTHAFLYNSLEDLINYIEHLNKKKNQHFVTHILKDKLLYSNNFEEHEAELINHAIKMFKLKSSKPSLAGVQQIDAFLNKNLKTEIDPYLFTQILAYIGVVMKSNLPLSKWYIIRREDDSVIEPYIISNNKLYNPFFFTYRELYENRKEERKVNLYDSLIIEIGK